MAITRPTIPLDPAAAKCFEYKKLFKKTWPQLFKRASHLIQFRTRPGVATAAYYVVTATHQVVKLSIETLDTAEAILSPKARARLTLKPSRASVCQDFVVAVATLKRKP
jgi:hypothetical protein